MCVLPLYNKRIKLCSFIHLQRFSCMHLSIAPRSYMHNSIQNIRFLKEFHFSLDTDKFKLLRWSISENRYNSCNSDSHTINNLIANYTQ